MAVAISSQKRWCDLSQPEKLSRWLAHQRYVRNAEQRHSGTHWLETITAARFEGYDKMGNPKWVYRLKYVGWGPRWNRWEEEGVLLIDESQIGLGRPQIVNAFWGSLSKEDRQRIPLMKIKDIICPGQRFIEERRDILEGILQSPEYQEYLDKTGHVGSETEMSDLEVDVPKLFNTLKKVKGKRPKKYKSRERVLTRKARSTSKVKRLKLCVQQAAGIPPIPSDTANQEQQEHHFVPATQASFPPSVFQGTPLRASRIPIGPNFNVSSSSSELVQANNRRVSMFQVNIPERGYHVAPSQNPKRRTIFEEPQYTDNGDFPMVNRTYELVRKNLVAPMWSELPLEDDLPRHDQQLPTHTEESMEAVGCPEMAEVLSYLKDDPDDLFGDAHLEMDMDVDSTDVSSSGHNTAPPASDAPSRTVLEPHQVEVSVLGTAGSVGSVVLNLLDLAVCDDFGDLIQSIKQHPDLGLEGPYDNSELCLEGWQVQDAVIGVEVSDGGGFQDVLLGVAGPKFYRLCSGSNATNFIIFNPARPPAWFMVPEEAQECQLALWKL